MPMTLVWLVWPVLALAGCGAALARAAGAGPAWRAAGAGLAAVLGLIPVGDATAAHILLALTGPGSAASVLLAALALHALVGSPRPRQPSAALLAAIVALGLLLLPATAGLTVFDPFEWGYRGLALPAILAALAASGWYLRAADLCAFVLLATAMHAFAVYGAVNLWTYVVDPVATLAAAAWLGFAMARAPAADAPAPPSGA
ncbi:MAG: hypothetical protein IT538_12770 [Variibacter sp.]|nr:hypothetical protein [Variibacter sp.]